MNWWILLGIALAVALGYTANRLGWIDLSNKNRRGGSSGALVHIGDEVFAPSRHEAAIELDRQTVLPAPAPLAGDKGIAGPAEPGSKYDGRIRIDV
ncbi:hypothetical protein [Luethyella okanaganae]|uniref:Uncharacterized protein n=1 Tax=Luethyella okanaganae TaxID=69372 RepID=A0ABW1VFF5_9MICO